MIPARIIFLILFLYEALVWAVAWYRTPKNFIDSGLWFTIVGLAVLLFLVVASWLVSVAKAVLGRVKPRPKPAPAPNPQPPANDDELAFRKLLVEAAARLKTSPKFAGNRLEGLRLFSGMPLYLVVGLEASGKSSVLAGSGLNLELLAGQSRFDKYAPASTALANIWLAGETVFIEIGGRHFAGNARRWEDLLQTLTAKPKDSFWRRLFQKERPGFELRGVIYCCDVHFFLSKPGPDQIERQSQLVQERLRAALKIFGRRFPVYTVVTKADEILYFRDFFGRFSEKEAREVLGCTLPKRRAEEGSDQTLFVTEESRRLSRALHKLYTSLTERRLSVLFSETQDARKAKIYEFPREFYRVRKPIVEFLVQICRPSPLEPSPFNRGVYFSGTREIEQTSSGSDISQTSTDLSIFSGPLDATSVFHADQASSKQSTPFPDNSVRVRRGGLQSQWMFLTSLFQDVVSRDQSSERITTIAPGYFQNQRTVLTIGVATATVLALLWVTSWIKNWNLLADVQDVAAQRFSTPTSQDLPSIEELKSLESLRVRVARLSANEREGARYLMRLGLYSGSKVTIAARRKYFGLLKASLLDSTNDRLGKSLLSGSPPVDGNSQDVVTSNRLKSYVMTTTPAVCSADANLVSTELILALRSIGIKEGDPRFALASQQLDFYAKELELAKKDTPEMQVTQLAVLTMDPAARDAGVRYLINAGRSSEYTQTAIKAVERKMAGPARIGKIVPEYQDFFSHSRSEVSAAFTPDGRSEFRAELDNRKEAPRSDDCIARLTSDGARSASLDADTRNRIEDQYAREYFATWRQFVSDFKVVNYGSAADAAKKLKRLGSFDSPLLGLLRFVADNTNYSNARTDDIEGTLSLPDWFKKNGNARLQTPPSEVRFTFADIGDALRPVHLIVDSTSPTWITDKNKPYTDALLSLAEALEAIGNSKDPDPALYTPAEQASTKAKAVVQQVTAHFDPTSLGGLSDVVKNLLEQPILAAGPFTTKKPGNIRLTLYSKLREFCRDRLVPVLDKYPFAKSGNASDLSLADLSSLFAPKSGVIYTTFADLVTQEGKSWLPKAGAPAIASTELLAFISRAQQVTNVFFADGVPLPHLTYTLRPRLAGPDQVIQLDLDGNRQEFSSAAIRQKDFDWPGAVGSQRASGQSGTRNTGATFSSHSGLWAVFKMFRDADPRALGDKSIRWSSTRGPSGDPGPINPPVSFEFVGDSYDVFNPQFFADFRCPAHATQ